MAGRTGTAEYKKLRLLEYISIFRETMTLGSQPEIKFDRTIPEGQECDQCENIAVLAHPIICEGGKVETGFMCQDCLDSWRRDYREEKYGDRYDTEDLKREEYWKN
jgi:hypothetical protein